MPKMGLGPYRLQGALELPSRDEFRLLVKAVISEGGSLVDSYLANI